MFRFVPALVFAFVLTSTAVYASPAPLDDIASDCPAGTRRATAADVPIMIAANIKEAKEGTCWNPIDKTVGQTDGEAKQYLRSILCPPDGDNYGGTGPDGTIQGLDAKFAVCAAKFLKASQAAGINVCIREGKRTVERQNAYVARGVIACKKGAQCEHPRGVAIDVNVRPGVKECTSYSRLHNSAGQFGLTFYLGCKDAYHVVPVKGGCSGGGTIADDDPLPATYYDYPQYAPTQPTPAPLPSSGISSSIRQALGMTPQTTATAQTAQSEAQPQICTPEFSCTNSTMYYKTTSCTTQVYQTCPYGCNGSSCNLSTSTAATTGITVSTVLTGTTSESTNTNSNTNANTDAEASTTQSVSDILNSFLEVKPVEIGTSTSIVFRLNAETGDVEQLDQRPTASTLRPAQETISSIQPVNAQQTFTSSDLSGYTSSYYTNTQTSGFQKALENMKAALLWALSVLRPFGGGTADHQFAP
jgi:hypothetical protein